MAVVKIIEHQFQNEAGQPVKYERLAIIGYVSGEVHTLELKLEKSEILLAKMLLNSEEEKPLSVISSPSPEEKAAFDENVNRKMPDPADFLSGGLDA